MAKVWPTKVMMNNTITSVTASEARNSTWVSFGLESVSCSFSDIGSSASSQLPDDPESAVPAGDLKYVQRTIDEMKNFITCRRRLRHVVPKAVQRPIDNERAPDDVFLRHKTPVAAVRAVIAVVAHHEIVAGRND